MPHQGALGGKAFQAAALAGTDYKGCIWNDKAKWDYYDLGPYVVDKNGEKKDFCKVKDAVLTEDQHISEILLPDGIWLFDKPNRNYADVASIINNLGSELYVSLLNCHI